MRRIKPGSIIAASLPLGTRYIELIGKRWDGIDLFAVLDAAEDDFKEKSIAPTPAPLYYFCSFARLLLEDSRFKFVEIRDVLAPMPLLRRRFTGGWKLIRSSDGAEQRFVSDPIDHAVAQLSIDEAIPVELLVRRLANGWRPEFEQGAFISEIRRSRGDAPTDSSREVIFYINFVSPLNRSKAMVALRRSGFNCTADVSNRTLAVTKHVEAARARAELREIETAVGSIAEKHGGDITGYEIEGTLPDSTDHR